MYNVFYVYRVGSDAGRDVMSILYASYLYVFLCYQIQPDDRRGPIYVCMLFIYVIMACVVCVYVTCLYVYMLILGGSRCQARSND